MNRNYSTGKAREDQQFVKQKQTVQTAGGSGANLGSPKTPPPPSAFLYLAQDVAQLPVSGAMKFKGVMNNVRLIRIPCSSEQLGILRALKNQ